MTLVSNKQVDLKQTRGYWAIGVYHPKTEANIGTLWRSAYIFGASYIFTIGHRYKNQSSDTPKTFRHVPMYHYVSFEDFNDHRPTNAILVFVEITNGSLSLDKFSHPERAIYILGAEDHGIPQHLMNGSTVVQIPSMRDRCLNVASAGSILMYDRFVKELK